MNIDEPPLIVEDGVSTEQAEHMRNAWRSWPEHYRHLILDRGIQLVLRSLESPADIRTIDATHIEVNANRMPHWEKYPKTVADWCDQENFYGFILFTALCAAAPRIVKEMTWVGVKEEYDTEYPTKGEVTIPLMLAAVRNDMKMARIKNQPDFIKGGTALTNALREFNSRIERAAYRTPALRERYEEVVHSEVPRIITNVSEYGHIEQKYIDKFKQAYAKWPQKYRDLIEANNITFVLGESIENIVEDGDKKFVGVSQQTIEYEEDAHQLELFDNNLHASKEENQWTREFLLVALRALAVAVGPGPSTIDWETASQEVESKHKVVKETNFPNIFGQIASIVLFLQAGVGEKHAIKHFKRSSPAAGAAYEQYTAFIDEEHAKLMQKREEAARLEIAAKYQASSTAFAINREPNGLTSPQQQYFEKLNEIVALLGVTPKAFDDAFRRTILAQISVSAYTAEKILLQDPLIEQSPETKKDIENGNKAIRKIEEKLGHKIGFIPILRIGHGSTRSVRKLQQIDETVSKEIEATQHKLENDNFILRNYIAHVVDTLDPIFHIESKTNGSIESNRNILQCFANGRHIFANLDLLNLEYTDSSTHLDFIFTDAKASDHFRAGVRNTALGLAQQQSLAANSVSEITRRLNEMDALWPKVTMSQEEYALMAAREAREKARREKDAEEAREQAKRRAIEAAERIEAERARRETFMAKPQPYMLRENINDDARSLCETLRQYADRHTDDISAHAKPLVALIDKVTSRFDCRNDGIDALGAMLFSAGNIAALANAFSAANPIVGKGVLPVRASAATARQLSTLYTFAPAVRETIDALLEEPDGIVLLASLTRPPERCKQYVSYLYTTESALNRIHTRIASLEARLQGFSTDDLAALKDDLEVVQLNKEHADYAKKQTELENTRRALADEIRQSFQGLNLKKIASAAVPVATLAKQAGIALPDKWLEAMNGEFHPQPGEDDKHVCIASNEFPYKGVTIKLKAGNETFERELRGLRAECEQHRVNLDTLRSLGQSSGFQLVSQEGKTALHHPEYGITQILDGPEVEQTKALLVAQRQFEERKFQQQSIIEMAKQAGVSVPLRKYFSADDFETVQNALDIAQEPHDLPHTAPLETEAAMRKRAAKTAWQPNGETMLIFDANVLYKLAADRGDNGATWLDIIKCTARLPNVKVIIPAVIADWELQGKIPTYDDAGNHTGFRQVDPRFQEPSHPLSYIAEPISNFLESASRAKIEANGSVSLVPGANQNIIVMETEGDQELYGRIRRILAMPERQQVEAFQQHVHKKGEGEKAINRILATIPYPLPAIVVSDDMHYFRDPNAPVQAPLTTGQGMPVGQSSTGCYLDAELQKREQEIRQMLEENKRITPYRLGNEINAYWEQFRPDDYLYLNYHSQRGQYAAPNNREPNHIYSLIGTGVELSKTYGNGSSKGPVRDRFHPGDPMSRHHLPPHMLADDFRAKYLGRNSGEIGRSI